MIYTNLTNYLKALNRYRSTPGKIINGEGFVFSNGDWIAYDEYNKHNSTPTYEPVARDNADGQNISPSIKVKRR